LLVVLLTAVAWCALHSLPITRRAERWVAAHGPAWTAWYRLAYNLFSGATLLAAWLVFRAHPGRPLWHWDGAWAAVRWLLLAAGLYLGWLGTRCHDNDEFLGLAQVRAFRRGRSLPPPRLSRDGILGAVRHPYYASGILVLIAWRDVTSTDLVWRSVFVIYLLLGAWLEERKLLARFGDAYRRYRREVPAFVPRPRDWRRLLP